MILRPPNEEAQVMGGPDYPPVAVERPGARIKIDPFLMGRNERPERGWACHPHHVRYRRG